tara:strand:- start:11350 stop:12138 length:789 start_codon:yes stop_codon:yes gene_type:complete
MSVIHLKTILTHVIIGMGLFYFLIHPFTMVLYWFEFNNTAYSFTLFQEVLSERLVEAFTFKMVGMSGILTVLGGLLGFVSGLIWINIKKKKDLITKQKRLLQRDINELIAMGENEWVEFKSSIRYDYYRKTTNRSLEGVIAKTISGFMNAKGGRLIIGVDDDGNVLGLENDFKTLKHKNKDGFEREVFRIISEYLSRKASFGCHLSFYRQDLKDICLVDVEPSSDPVYVKDGKNTVFYIRTGNATYPLSVEETVEYLKIQKA